MGTLIRGVKNAFRNLIRTVSVTMILALSIGLALIMLLSFQTVKAKITNVKQSVGTTITVNPAGAFGGEGGGEPLTSDQAATIKGLAHVSTVTSSLQDRLTPGDNNSLASAIDPGTLGNRNGKRQFRQFEGTPPGGATGASSSGATTRTFTVPIQVTGVSSTAGVVTSETKITAGTIFDAASGENVAALGTALAAKNNLSVGSTFTAYGQTIKVVAIYDAGNEFSNAGLYMPIKTLQTLSDQAGQITSITATGDSIDNVDGVVSAIKDKLGSNKVDVTSTKAAADEAIAPLENIKSISFYSLMGALVAGAVITLLIMMMIVRERRREIGVLKAIGSSNIAVVMQFVYESLVLTLLGSVIGMILGVALSNPVLKVLVNNASSSSTGAEPTISGPGGQGFRAVVRLGGGIQDAVQNVHATVGLDIILYGLLAAIAIAIIGSAIPAFLIAKIKPAEVMRAE